MSPTGKSAQLRKPIEAVDPPTPPFWGSRIADPISLSALEPFINRASLFKGRWGVKKRRRSDEEYDRIVKEQLEPTLDRLLEQAQREQLVNPAVVYGYFPCNSEHNSLHIYLQPDDDAPLLTLEFPRQKQANGRSIADFFIPLESGTRDVLAVHLVTIGPKATEEARRLYAADDYPEYLYLHGLATETAEALAEFWHREIRRELGFAGDDGPNIASLLRQHYRGCRYSFGYPACPRLEDQAHIFTLLEPERIGLSLTEDWQLVPEHSTSAIIAHHPSAAYFAV